MKKYWIISFGLLLSGSLFAKTDCHYQIDTKDIKAEWTGFKTSEKAGVNGTFKQTTFKFENGAKSLKELFSKGSFSIEAASVFTNNPARDTNLTTNFFSKLIETAAITGKVENIKGDDQKGTFDLILTFNKTTKPVAFEYMVLKDEITATGSMDLINFNANSALSSLNQACLELHKGKDGVSKTWPEVLLKVSTKFKKEC